MWEREYAFIVLWEYPIIIPKWDNFSKKKKTHFLDNINVKTNIA